MEQVLSKLRGIADQPYEYLRQWKQENGRKIIGCMPMYVPEELIHAAGMLPVVLQKTDEEIEQGPSNVQSYFCGIVRCIGEMIQEHKLDWMDGIVSPDTCLAIRGLSNIARMHKREGEYHFDLVLPLSIKNKAAEPYLRAQLAKFKATLEDHFGVKIENEALRRSIGVFNENRALLRQIYALRRDNPALISAADLSSVVLASMVMPKEEHSVLARELIGGLQKKQASAGDAVKIVLSGSLCEFPTREILDLIEEAGCTVVGDDLYTGGRYINADLATDGDPMAAIVHRHLNMVIPCPTRFDQGRDLGSYLIDLVKANRAEGVIFLIVKFCQPHDMHHPFASDKLDDAGIPSMVIETEYEMPSVGQVKTRVQAFLEMLRRNTQ